MLHNLGQTSCWSTGRKGGHVFLHRVKHVGDTIYQPASEYAEELKHLMDPVVTHVEESWADSRRGGRRRAPRSTR